MNKLNSHSSSFLNQQSTCMIVLRTCMRIRAVCAIHCTCIALYSFVRRDLSARPFCLCAALSLAAALCLVALRLHRSTLSLIFTFASIAPVTLTIIYHMHLGPAAVTVSSNDSVYRRRDPGNKGTETEQAKRKGPTSCRMGWWQIAHRGRAPRPCRAGACGGGER